MVVRHNDLTSLLDCVVSVDVSVWQARRCIGRTILSCAASREGCRLCAEDYELRGLPLSAAARPYQRVVLPTFRIFIMANSRRIRPSLELHGCPKRSHSTQI